MKPDETKERIRFQKQTWKIRGISLHHATVLNKSRPPPFDSRKQILTTYTKKSNNGTRHIRSRITKITHLSNLLSIVIDKTLRVAVY